MGGFSNFKRCILLLMALVLGACVPSDDGENNPPVAGPPILTDVDEGDDLLNGQLTSTDPDDDATATYSISTGSSAPAGFNLNTDGSYSFDPADPAYDPLNVGGSNLLVIPVTVTDDQDETDTTQIQITVNGTNDTPVAGSPVIETVNAGDVEIFGQLTFVDVDDATAIFSLVGAAPAGLQLNIDGSFSFNPADVAYASLIAGESQLVTASITVTDDQSATDTTQIEITVSGVNGNNIPVAVDDTFNTFGNTSLEVGVPASGNIAVIVAGSVLDNDSDLDAADVLTVSLNTAPASGLLTLNAQGGFTYIPAAGLTSISDSFSYDVSDGKSISTATVTINITDRIWYVDNLSAGGSGTSVEPFAALSQAEIAVSSGDTIYIANGDSTTLGLDGGITFVDSDISLIGEGVALEINSVMLASAGTMPTLTSAGSAIDLHTANNTFIAGVTIDAAANHGISVDNSSGVILENVIIRHSNQSAIYATGADVGLELVDVVIDTVGVFEPEVSDDAIFIEATSTASFSMRGGSISNVPGNLADGIVLRNTDSTTEVLMTLDVRDVSFSGIGQDGIKLDNDNGAMNVQIGGVTTAEGNVFGVEFRGIYIQTDQDSLLNRTNTILIQNNNITSGNEGIQIRHISDLTELSILDNVLNNDVPSAMTELIDIQAELGATPQARISRNSVSNILGDIGIKLRVLDGATLTIETLDNEIDGPIEAFDFDVVDTTSVTPTRLNATVLNNTLSNISFAMNARNASINSSTCLDLQGNSAIADYELDVLVGSFELTAASQTIVLNPAGGSFTNASSCAVPTF